MPARYDGGMARIRSFIVLHRREALFAAAVFFTSSLSVGLGYIADQDLNGRPIIIEECSAPGARDTAAATATGTAGAPAAATAAAGK